MPRIEIRTWIDGSVDRVFDSARSAELCLVAIEDLEGRTDPGGEAELLELGDRPTWSVRFLGRRLQLVARVIRLDRPRSFRVAQVSGPFAAFDCDHIFEPENGGTWMIDRFAYTAPFGLVGRLANRLFFKAHLRRALERRAHAVKQAVESVPPRHLVDETSDAPLVGEGSRSEGAVPE